MAADLVVLGAIAVAQLAAQVALSLRWSKERERLTDAVIARHAGDVAAMRRADQPKAPREPKPEPPEQIGL